MADKAPAKETILNIPQPPASRQSAATPSEASEEPEPSEADDCEDGIGEFDDGRSGKLTLAVLIQDGIIEPGEGVMAVDYLGQTFKGDLMPNGKIKSLETNLVFNNPSAWAMYCKKIVNPSKKSGCGERWASVKYKGKKMDTFKTVWAKMKAKKEAEAEENNDNSRDDEDDSDSVSGGRTNGLIQTPVILKHSQLAPKHPSDLTNILLEVDSFQALGKIQPFGVSIASSALLIMDLHSHMISTPVCGYLAGQWDLNAHNLAVTHTFPCMTRTKDDEEEAQKVESEIYAEIYSKHLTLVGWYRSCPGYPALPSLKDSECQLDHQIKLLGNSDASYSPCVGLMTSPYASGSNESIILPYWVLPPPDTVPPEYGKPMKMGYSLVTDPCLSQETLNLITQLVQFYKTHPRRVRFTQQFNSDTKFITKMGRTLLPKFPRDQDERLWRYIRMLILGSEDAEIDDPLLIRPPLPNGINSNSANGQVSGARRNSSRRGTNDEDFEEEIDDDEENALRNVQRNGSTDMRTPPIPTENVISMLLQNSLNNSNSNNSSSNNKALDFSKQ